MAPTDTMNPVDAQHIWQTTARRAVWASAVIAVLGCAAGLLVGSEQPSVALLAFAAVLLVWPVAVISWSLEVGARSRAQLVSVVSVVLLVACAGIAGVVFGGVTSVAMGVAVAAFGLAAGVLLTCVPWRDPQRVELIQAAPVRVVVPRAAGDSGAAYLGVLAAAVLIVFIPAAIIATTDNESGRLWLWSMVIIAISGWRLAWLIRRGDRRLYEMTFWVFTYTFMGLAALAQIREHSWPNTILRSDWTLVPAAALVVIIGCLAFLVGAYVSARLDRFRSWDQLAPTGERLITISYRKLLALTVFTVLFNVYYLSKVGIIQFTQSREQAFAAYDVVWRPGSLGILVRACTFMSLLVTWLAWMRFRKEMTAAAEAGVAYTKSQKVIAICCAWGIGVLLLNSMNPISNARYLSGTAILAATVAFGWFATKARYRAMVMGFVLALVVVFPLADAFRYSDSAEVKSSNPLQSLMSADYDSFGQITNGLLIADRDGIAFGRQMLGVLFWWVPRTLWDDKPKDTGIFIANGRGYKMTNLSAPLWIELFLNGGWVVMVLGMALIGFYLYRWDSRIEAQMRVAQMPGVLGSVLPFYLLILMRGSMLQAMSYLMFILVFAAMVRRSPPNVGGPMNKKWLPGSMAYSTEPQPDLSATRQKEMAR